MAEFTKFVKGGWYHNRIGKYQVIELLEDDKMAVYCDYDGKNRIFNKMIAQMTIYNLGRGR